MKRLLAILLPLMIMGGSASAQSEDLVRVTTQASVTLPADLIRFRINLNAEAPSPREAYDLHKQREQVLVTALKTHQIDADNIRFEPVSIRKTAQNRPDASKIRTNQQVLLTLNDFEVFEEIQVTLIKNGFNNFSGSFTSTQIEKGKNQALRKAIRKAREKAELIADEAGLQLQRIKQITYGERRADPVGMRVELTSSQDYSPSLMEFDQTVSVTASVSIDYSIKTN